MDKNVLENEYGAIAIKKDKKNVDFIFLSEAKSEETVNDSISWPEHKKKKPTPYLTDEEIKQIMKCQIC